MKNTYFKMIGQKAMNGKLILIAVVDDDFLNIGEMPNIFESQCVNQAPTIYTGSYPNIRVILETLKERKDLEGLGINGILMKEGWYCQANNEKDIYGIALPEE